MPISSQLQPDKGVIVKQLNAASNIDPATGRLIMSVNIYVHLGTYTINGDGSTRWLTIDDDGKIISIPDVEHLDATLVGLAPALLNMCGGIVYLTDEINKILKVV